MIGNKSVASGQVDGGDAIGDLQLQERIAQYAHQLWHAVLAIVLLRRESQACGF
jgi:hypothetical protein